MTRGRKNRNRKARIRARQLVQFVKSIAANHELTKDLCEGTQARLAAIYDVKVIHVTSS